jgi:hypothetical protein
MLVGNHEVSREDLRGQAARRAASSRQYRKKERSAVCVRHRLVLLLLVRALLRNYCRTSRRPGFEHYTLNSSWLCIYDKQCGVIYKTLLHVCQHVERMSVCFGLYADKSGKCIINSRNDKKHDAYRHTK